MIGKRKRLEKVFQIFFSIAAVAIIVIIGSFSLYMYRNDIIDRYKEIAANAVNISSDGIDGDEVIKSIEEGELTLGLTFELKLMNKIKNNSNIAYMYMVYFPEEGSRDLMRYVMYANTQRDRDNGIPDSTVNAEAGDEFHEDIWDAFYEMQFGGSTQMKYMLNVYQNMDTTAPVITAFKPILDSDGDIVCIIGADIFTSVVKEHTVPYVIWLVITAVAALILGLIGYSRLSRKYIVNPIADMAGSASNFVKQTRSAKSPSDIKFDVIKVKQDTEIRDLSLELSSMMGETRDYMVDLRRVTAEKQRITTELAVATQIQEDMLPRIFPPFPDRKEFTIYAAMAPAKEVGGDFYDFFFTDDDHFAMVMADVSGKGVPAALFMAISKALIKNNAQRLGADASPAKILYEVNNQLCEGNDAELFVTVWLGIIELSTGKGIAANAGHEHPAFCRKGGKYELVIYQHSLAAAILKGAVFKEHEFQMDPGDSLFVYTDGVPEATSEDDELYGTDRMLNALNRDVEADAETVLKNVRADVDAFVKNAPQFDDLTMLCFQYEGPVKEEKQKQYAKRLRFDSKEIQV